MRAKQSSTASGMYRRSGSLTTPIPICAATTSLPDAIALYGAVPPSVVTAKPAIRGHFKTGHRDWPKT